MGAVGDRERLAAILASGDMLVHGSGAETYGLVVAEAIASGLAVVSPDSGGAADLARRGLSRLYPTGEAEGCAQAILALLGALESPGRGPPPPDHIGSAESHFAALFELYEGLIAARAPRRVLAHRPLAELVTST
jgi:alpha-1,6-mannosyltransferase